MLDSDIDNNKYIDYHFVEVGFNNPLDLRSYKNKPISSKTIRIDVSS